MSDPANENTVIGPDGQPIAMAPALESDERSERNVTDLVEQPAKVMRIGRMVQQLLEEVKSAPVDEPGRTRLAKILHTSIQELKKGLAPELDEELDRLIEPFDAETPTESELRIAQAQLVGWLEGLFHGIQTAIYAQQMAARSQLEEMRALPPGAMPGMPGQGQGHGQGQGQGLGQGQADEPHDGPGSQGGMYL